MIKKLIPVLSGVILIDIANLAAYADDMLDKDYIINKIWSGWWCGKGDDGLTFPEASYKHHILTEWVQDNYDNEDYEWGEIGELQYSFRDYYKNLTDEWDFNDARDGNWIIVTDETTYHFNLENGRWLMSDQNGDVIDSFMPFSTLKEEVKNPDNSANYEIEGNDSNGHRVGEGLMIENSASAEIAETESSEKTERSSSNSLIYGICGIAIAGITVLAGIFIKKKRS